MEQKLEKLGKGQVNENYKLEKWVLSEGSKKSRLDKVIN